MFPEPGAAHAQAPSPETAACHALQTAGDTASSPDLALTASVSHCDLGRNQELTQGGTGLEWPPEPVEHGCEDPRARPQSLSSARCSLQVPPGFSL